MRKIFLTLLACAVAVGASALEPVKLNEPDLKRGKSLMQALSGRESQRKFEAQELSLQDMSDLLWAANGINRSNGKRTAPSAMDKQDIVLYVLTAKGSYRYDHKEHLLEPIKEGDFRQKVRNNASAINVLLVANDGNARHAYTNAGYVSENIYLVCSALDMGTVACGSMDEDAFRKACNLKERQKVVVWHPVGYPAE